MAGVRASVRVASLASRAIMRVPVTAATAAPRVAVPLRARALSTSAVLRAQDRSWVDRGPVTYEELKPYTEAPSGKITIIDVREPNEVAQGMIPSAVNVPLSEFSQAFDVDSESGSSTDFERKFSFARPSYDHEIVLYCRSGRRSQEAMEIANKRGWWKYVHND